MSPERLAAAARARHDELLELVALRSEAIAAALRDELGMVAWDRQAVVGRAQRALRRLAEEPPRAAKGPTAARVIERARQPLDALPAVWEALLRGCRVHVELERGASTAITEVLRPLGERLGDGGARPLTVAAGDMEEEGEGDPPPEGASGWPQIGVEPAAERLGVVGVDGDPELAAYVLARTCLRRAGAEPRAIHRALVCGPSNRLERYLQRLWVGVVIGPADDPDAFSGPATPALAHAYLAAIERWRTCADVEVLCRGGRLLRAGDDALYLAPALFRRRWPRPADAPASGSPALPLVGPMLAIEQVEEASQGEAIAALDVPARRQLWIAPPPLGGVAEGGPRYVEGALVVERMPPGLPEPRPV
ncbi:MAG: hypothetical protein R3A79_25270 [Nannocystaceae bacterium]